MSNVAVKYDDLVEQAVTEVKSEMPRTYQQAGSKIGWRETGDERGRGVFAMEDIPQGAMIEEAPVILVAAEDVPESGNAPDGYLLDWEPDEEGEELSLIHI